MEFPTLTSGAIGALTFTHLNQVFDRIEKLEREAAAGAEPSSRTKRGIIFPARVTAYDSTNKVAAFEEVTRANPETSAGQVWMTVEGGVTSLVGDNQFGIPLIGSGGQVGAISYVFLRGGETSGSLYYETIAPRQAGLYYIAYASGSDPRWTYYAYPAEQVGSTFAPEAGWPSAEFIQIYNTCEFIDDTPTNIGVGTVLPSGVQAFRQPIKSNLTVPCIPDRNGILAFAVPNGYRIVCP